MYPGFYAEGQGHVIRLGIYTMFSIFVQLHFYRTSLWISIIFGNSVYLNMIWCHICTWAPTCMPKVKVT